jgi:hypothetical protein
MHGTYNIKTFLTFKKCITNDTSQVGGFATFVFVFNDYSEWGKNYDAILDNTLFPCHSEDDWPSHLTSNYTTTSSFSIL